MKQYSEKELLLLSNLVYFDFSVWPGTIQEKLDSLKDEAGQITLEKVRATGLGGGLTAEEALDLFQTMDAASTEFKGLSVSEAVNTDIRAVYFTSPEYEDAAVVFRGTGGSYDAWEDNVLGEYKSQTRLQKEAVSFVEEKCPKEKKLVVTGHSKGGNLAQYVTIKCPEQVKQCVSYDGQGMGKSLLDTDATGILLAKDKITSISAENDFVNILLTPVAGRRVFAKNHAQGINGHSSYWLLASNEFDENGKLTSLVTQSLPMAVLERATAKLVKEVDDLPQGGNCYVSNLLAALTASVMSADRQNEEQSEIRKAAGALSGYSAALFTKRIFPAKKSGNSQQTLYCTKLYLEPEKVITVIEQLNGAADRQRSLINQISEISQSFGYYLHANMYAKEAIQYLLERMDKNYQNTKLMGMLLEDILNLYKKKEYFLLNCTT